MKNRFPMTAAGVTSMMRTANLRRSVMVALAAGLLLRSYVIRELVVTEVFLTLMFGVVALVAGTVYLVASKS